jgi:gamma-glutamyltranspeptidase/glutathione hydrolase
MVLEVRMRFVVLVLAVLWLPGLTASSASAEPQPRAGSLQPEPATGRIEHLPVLAKEFMVAAAHPLAAMAGYDVLRRGGSAIDAAVAVQMVLNVVEPQSSGIGGGAFMVYWDAKAGRLTSFDGREVSPAAAGPGYFLQPDGTPKSFWEAMAGGRSVGVPGTLRMLEMAHQRYGREPWGRLFDPAIAHAEKGFAISPRLAASIGWAANKGLAAFPEAAAYFFNADGTPKPEGAILTNPALAETFRILARDGADALHQGSIAEAIVAAISATPDNPGVMTLEDLRTYKAKQREPVCAAYRGHDVCGMGPPSSGALTIGQILGMLEHFDLAGIGPSPEAAHLFAEASKLAYADRALYMADSDFVRMPTKGLLDQNYLTIRAQHIRRGAAMEKAEAGNPPWWDASLQAPDTEVERPGTSHFVIFDGEGNAVSMTTTIETGFGSRVMVRGFLLNNELTDFSFRPAVNGRSVANRVEGGKRPRSSMAPTIVLRDGKPVLLIGSPGGSRIIAYVAQAVIGILDWGMDPQAAINIGHVVNRNGATDLEAGTDAADLAGPLTMLGHEVQVRDLNSGLHAIQIGPDGKLVGGADPRREGVVLGD